MKKLSSEHLAMTNQTPRKHLRKGEQPIHFSSSDILQDFSSANSWICKNSACKAVLTSEDTFCKRCSCCICHLFDDNKDPSLWLVCTAESDDKSCCGLSCHIECALQCQRAGVFNLGQSVLLDGSYCCASCGKVSGIIGCWKRQLMVAKDARRVDILCYRIFLSYRLLYGTSGFKELHQVVEEAKAKLEKEVGPVDGVSAKMARGIVSRLSIAGDIQKLCSAAIEKADKWLSPRSSGHFEQNHKGSLPAACRFQFEEITSSSLVIVLKETASSIFDAIQGYKLWYCQTRDQPYTKDPVIFQRAQRRILITNLQPCTEYAFRIISFTEYGDFGHSESKCFTKSKEIINKHIDNNGVEGCSSSDKHEGKTTATKSSGFKVRNLGKILQLAWAQENGSYDGFYEDDVEEESCGGSGEVIAEAAEAMPRTSRRLDLNVASVPDLNAEVIPPMDCFPDEENAFFSEKIELARSNGSGDSGTCAATVVHEVPAVESRPECSKQPSTVHDETCEGNSTLVSGSPRGFKRRLGELDDNYEYCVKVIRWLECLGHFDKDFRMRFLTWFSLRSTEQERRVVITFIRTLIEDPSSLAGQLLDSFADIVTCNRLHNGFCSKLWH